MDFGSEEFEWIFRLQPVPDDVFRPALMSCIDRYTATGVAVLLGYSVRAVQQWRQGRRNAKPTARRAVMLLSVTPIAEVEKLYAQIMEDSDVDQPVKTPKRTLPVVVSCDYEI
jgi:hypothetical protein